MIGNKLKEIRKKNNYSIRKFAEIMNVSRQTVQNYEDGKTIPDILYIKKISKEFDIPLENLVYDETDEIPKKKSSDPNSNEFEGQFHLLLSKCKNIQESTMIYDLFLSLYETIYYIKFAYDFYGDDLYKYIKELKDKQIDFDDAYRIMFAYPYLIQGNPDSLNSVHKNLNKILNFYTTEMKNKLYSAFDEIYGRHEMD